MAKDYEVKIENGKIVIVNQQLLEPMELGIAIPYFGQYCQRCAHPLPLGSMCSAHRDDLEHLDQTLAVGVYYTQDVTREYGLWNMLTSLILNLKNHMVVAPMLASAMAYVVESGLFQVGVEDIDFITYVPKHPNELKIDTESGASYNQAQLLANYIASYLNLPLEEVLEKKKPLSMQGLSLQDRYTKSQEVYQVREQLQSSIEDARILLIDDVRTSGATANVIAKKMKEAGTKKVYLLVAGRASYKDLFAEIISEK